MADEQTQLVILVGFDLTGVPFFRVRQFLQSLLERRPEAHPRLFLSVVPAGSILQEDRQAGINLLGENGITNGCRTASLI
jgi:hypothetical protein